MQKCPPEESASGAVRVRRWRVEDVDELHDLLLANLDHLRPWMAWIATEPIAIEERRNRMTEWIAKFDRGEDFSYAIADVETGELLGGSGLHRRIGPDGFEIGYWVRGDRTGNGIATHAVRALTAAAFEVDGISHVEIHHDAANAASRRVPEKLGFTHVGEQPDEIVAPAEVGIDVHWRLDRPPG